MCERSQGLKLNVCTFPQSPWVRFLVVEYYVNYVQKFALMLVIDILSGKLTLNVRPEFKRPTTIVKFGHLKGTCIYMYAKFKTPH